MFCVLPAGKDFRNLSAYIKAITRWTGWTSHLSVISWMKGIKSGKWVVLFLTSSLLSDSVCVLGKALGNRMASKEDDAKSGVTND